MTSLNPVHTVGEQIVEAHPAAPSGRAAEARARALEMLRLVQDPLARDAARRLSAPALRRHAPARHDRHGAGLRSQAPDRRRADHGARRHHPGADPRPAARPARAHGHGDHADHPRSRRGRRARRPRARHVCRPHRRGGAGRRCCSPTRSIPIRSACWARSRGSAATATSGCRDRGRGAESLRPAAGLPLQPALPARRRALPGRAAALREIAPGHRAACWKAPLELVLPPPPHHERAAALRRGPHQALPGEARHRASRAPSARCAPSTASPSTWRRARRWRWSANPAAASRPPAAWCCA